MKTLKPLLTGLAVVSTGFSSAFAEGRSSIPHLSDNTAFTLFMLGIVAIGLWAGRSAMKPKR